MAIHEKPGTGVHTEFDMSKVIALVHNLLVPFAVKNFGEDADVTDALEATVGEFCDFLEELRGRTIILSEYGADDLEVLPDDRDR